MIWTLGSRRMDFHSRVQIMGILNVTPDSFFDGGRYHERKAAVERGLQMVEEGADIIDVGGESSRPPLYGEVRPVDVSEECERVVPVIEEMRRYSAVPISVDTTKAEVARQALRAGGDVINDISALCADPEMVEVAAAGAAPVILMHGHGRAPGPYANLLGELKGFLAERVAAAWAAGLSRERLALDPGIGFGKSPGDNLIVIQHLDVLSDMGCPVVLGSSRKSFIWKLLGLTPEESLEGSLAVAALSVARGVHILRVHDVRETVRAVRMAEAITGRID